MGVKVRAWKGAWWLFVHHEGRRKARRVGVGAGAKRAAQAAAEQIQAKLVLGDVSVLAPERSTTETLATFSEYWLRDHVSVYCRPATQQNYGHMFRDYWLPALGALPLNAVTTERIKGAVAGLLERLKPGTLRSALIPLRGCLNAAIEAGHLATNPTQGVGKLLARRTSGGFDPRDLFGRDELEKLATVAHREMPEHAALIMTLVRTGVRTGEAFALQPDDIDERAGYVWIRRTLSRGRTLSDRPKGRKARRIEMSPQLGVALQAQESLVRAEAALRGTEPFWLFPQPGTTPPQPIHSAWFHEYVWRPVLRRAGLRYRKPHMVRHSVASLLLHEGTPLPFVAELLGHHSPAFTATVYAHAMPNANRGVMARLDAAAGPGPRASERNPCATRPAVAAGIR
jgi:integrase